MGQHPITLMVHYSLRRNYVKFHLHMKDYKWDRKWMFMNLASPNRCPLQIQLQQIPFANGAKPHYSFRALWVMSLWLCLCASSIVFICTFHSWITSKVEKVIHQFFRGWHFYQWTRFFHPWINLVTHGMAFLFVMFWGENWKKSEISRRVSHSHMYQNSQMKIWYLEFSHKNMTNQNSNHR